MFGLNKLTNNLIFPTRVSFDGRPKFKAGGITIDWSTITAVAGSDATLQDGSIIRIGNKYIRYGQVMTKITGAANTLTVSATGGNYQINVQSALGGPVATANVAFGANAATIQAALTALANVGAGNVVVTGAGSPFTITPASILGTLILTLGTNTLTGGTVTFGASLTTGSTVGWFGPYDPAAADGRAVLSRGECFISDTTIPQYSASAAITASNDQVGSMIEGGDVKLDSIIQSGTAAHSLALGPTLAELLAALPSINLVKN